MEKPGIPSTGQELLVFYVLFSSDFGHTLLEHAVDLHAPCDADIGTEGIADHRSGHAVIGGTAVGHEGVETEVGTGLGVIFHAEAIGEMAVGGLAEDVVEAGADIAETGQGVFGAVLLVSPFDKDVELLVEIDIGAADNGEIVAPVLNAVGVVDEVEVDVPVLILQFVADGDIVHIFAVGTLEHVDGMEQLEVAHLAAVEEVVGHEAGFPLLSGSEAEAGAVVDIRRVAHLEKEHVVGVVAPVGGSHRRLEAIEIVPIIGAEEDVDGRSVVLETTNGESVLTETEHPVGGRGIVDVEEVGVVEEAYIARGGNDALAEEIAELLTNRAANDEVEITAVKAIGILLQGVALDSVVVIIEVGTSLKFNLCKDGGEVDLCRRHLGYCNEREQREYS